MKSLAKTIFWITLFSIAMGYLESAIVVYLRALYYPTGFRFPMKTIDHGNAVTEFWREAATLIMLYGVGFLAGKNKSQRFAFFIYSFAVWDIFYYVFLKALINWPESLFTWDILFLIPLPWVGPVLAPCIVSGTMIMFAMLILRFNEGGLNTQIIRKERILIIWGCVIIVGSFVQDYIHNLYLNHDLNIWTPVSKSQLFADFMTYEPTSFSWWLFWIGEICILSVIAMFFARQKDAWKSNLLKVRTMNSKS